MREFADIYKHIDLKNNLCKGIGETFSKYSM